MRILVAEDDPSLAEGLMRSLRQSGYAVDCVNDGDEADTAAYGAIAGRLVAAEHPALGFFRGRRGQSGQARDVAVQVGSSTSRVILRSAVLGSTGTAIGGSLVLAKEGPGSFDYADINIGVNGTLSTAGGVNTDLGGQQRSNPLFVADRHSVVLTTSSPARAAAVPQWQVGVERATVGAQGEWFQVAKNGKTTMGARP